MQISCVDYKKLDQGIRLDAEYYKPGFLKVEKILRQVNCKSLDDVSESIKSFGAYSLCNDMVLVDKGIPFIRCKDIKDGFVDFSEVLHIDEATHKLLSKSAINPHTVMLTMSGTVGNSAVADPSWKYPINSNQDIAKIETNQLVSPYYLTVFLNGKYGKHQTERSPVGSIQQHIFIWQLKGLSIFIASKDFQDSISKLYIKSIKSLRDSELFYSQAEQILLCELNLINWKPKHRFSFVKNYSNAQSAGRYDAEYFQPMYWNLKKRLIEYKNGHDFLCALVTIKDKNSMPKDNIAYKYIELANISINGDITRVTKDLGKELPSRARRKVNAGDVIVSSIEGSLSSIALVPKSLNNAICSTGFYVIKSDIINSETLLAFLKSAAGQLQLKKGCSGTILTGIKKGEFERIIIPRINDKTQEAIKNKITAMYNAKSVSNRLLNIAKCGVEMAIERNEEVAIERINGEYEKINGRFTH